MSRVTGNINICYHTEMTTLSDQQKEKVVLFDFDGTIADSFDVMKQVYSVLAKKHKFPEGNLTIEDMRKLSARELVSHFGIPTYKLPFLMLEGKKEFAKYFSILKPFPRLLPVLDELASDYTLGIVTSNDSLQVKAFLEKKNIPYFDFIYSERSLFGKPAVIKKLLRKYHLKKENVIYIGDEVRDIEAAREAGIKVGCVSWGFNTREVLLKNRPDFISDNPSQLLPSLTHVFKERASQ